MFSVITVAVASAIVSPTSGFTTLISRPQRINAPLSNGQFQSNALSAFTSQKTRNPLPAAKASARKLTSLKATDEEIDRAYSANGDFDLSTALFCSSLAFDAYSEPDPNSSRWERGASGVNVAFQSTAFTRSMYKGLLQIQPIKCIDLPDEDDTAEGLMTGSGTDAYLLVAVAEGKWKEDIEYIEKDKYNDGVLMLKGCAHVGRSSTAWSNIDEKKAKKMKPPSMLSGQQEFAEDSREDEESSEMK